MATEISVSPHEHKGTRMMIKQVLKALPLQLSQPQCLLSVRVNLTPPASGKHADGLTHEQILYFAGALLTCFCQKQEDFMAVTMQMQNLACARKQYGTT